MMAMGAFCVNCGTETFFNVELNEVFVIKCPKCGCAKFNKIAFEEFVELDEVR